MPPMRDVVLVVPDRIGSTPWIAMRQNLCTAWHGCSQPTARSATINRRSPENPTDVPLP
jgi:hypothetical protein